MIPVSLAAAALILSACDSAPPSATDVTQTQAAPTAPTTAPKKAPDVVYVPTPQPVVDAMLKMAKVGQGDVLYDLGSGDGRIPVTAAKQFGVRAVGIDIDPQRILEANANAKAGGVEKLVTFRNEDLFATDFSEATVVTLYLLPSLNEKLAPKLLSDLKPGTRIVSHAFRMGEWEPEETQDVNGSMIYRWTVPGPGEPRPKP